MQRTRLNGRRISCIIIPCIILLACILLDQLTKIYFKNNLSKGETIDVISNFFYFTYTVNTGAAWSFLADASWGQLFFKILTVVALIGFGFLMFYAIKQRYKWLSISIAFIIGGTIGNFIDRLLFNGVTDFIGFIFGNYYFPIFNLADSFLVVGVIMAVIHFLFLDNNNIFAKPSESNKAEKDNGDKEVSNK